MTSEDMVQFHGQGQGYAIVELSRAYNEKNSIREFVTNSLDARVSGQIEDISVISAPPQRRLIISDNGRGMTENKLFSLPLSVGYSDKRERTDQRGERGMGILGFGSLGEVMHVISRAYDGPINAGYSYVRWELGKNGVKFRTDRLSASDVEQCFGGVFKHGTRVIVDQIGDHVMEKVLTTPALKKWLQKLYAPALRSGIVNMSVGRDDGRRRLVSPVEAANYLIGSSAPFMDEVLRVPIKNEETPGGLEVVLFLNPDSIGDAVAVYSKDVLVYDSLTQLSELESNLVWNSGKVSGFINDRFNRLVLGRDAIDKNSRTYRAWFETIKEIEDKLRPIVAELSKKGSQRSSTIEIKKAYEAMQDAFKELRKLGLGGSLTRSGEGELVRVIGAQPVESGGGGGRRGPKTPSGKHPGPGTFVEDESGFEERVVPRGPVPFGQPQPIDFQISDAHLRSKLEDQLGTPIIYLNSAHSDYKNRQNASDKTSFLRYIVELVAKEAASYEIRNNERQGKLVGTTSDSVREALEKAEFLRFHTLNRLGIK